MIDFDARVNCSVSKAFGEVSVRAQVGLELSRHWGLSMDFADRFSIATGRRPWRHPIPGVRMVELRERYGQNDILVRKTGVRYRIAEPQPDGMGWINFKLKVSATTSVDLRLLAVDALKDATTAGANV